MSQKQVVTRFAPSPTGALHVGGARTALFAWAYARRFDGRFILRVEDTDKARSSRESAFRIMEDLAWLGISWDEEPEYQSTRLAGYEDPFVVSLLMDDLAYKKDGAIWLPVERDIAFDDEVYGHIEVKAEELEDFVIMKSDGYPTYHLAVVVDDHLMGVTHVLRGQEHLYNTPKHVALQDALELSRPVYAHMPSILNRDGSKMSKRDKAKTSRAAALAQGLAPDALESVGIDASAVEAFLSKESDDIGVAVAIATVLGIALPEIEVADFRRSGFLPETLCNYLSLLGWSPGGDLERFDRDYLIEHFDLGGIGKKSAQFDHDKLLSFNKDDLAAMPATEFCARWRAHCEAFEPDYIERLGDDAFASLAAAYQPRSRTLQEPCNLARFFIRADDEITYDAKAVKKWLRKNEDQGLLVLRALRTELEALASFDPEPIEACLAAYAEANELGMGKVAQPLRVAVSGAAVSPGIGETLAILGRASVLARIDRCLTTLATA